jgi:hypothetical protein
MNGEHLEQQQVRFWDIAKRGIAVADANVAFIVFYFAVDYLAWLGLSRIQPQLVSTAADSPPGLGQLMPYLLTFWVVTSSVQAFMDCVIARLLGKQVLSIQPDSGLLLVATLRKFYLRMLLLSAIHMIVLTFAEIIRLPVLYPAAYVVLRYVAAFVIWQDCGVRAAFSGLSGFLSVHLGKFLPVWLAGAALLIGTNLAVRSPASSNLVFMGLLHLVVAYFDFAVLA